MPKDRFHPDPRRIKTSIRHGRKPQHRWTENLFPNSNPPIVIDESDSLEQPDQFDAKLDVLTETRPPAHFPAQRAYDRKRSYDGRQYAADMARRKITRKKPLVAPPPCFYFGECKRRAEVEKQGKAVCTSCAGKLRGITYPLRAPQEHPPYASAAELAYAMDTQKG